MALKLTIVVLLEKAKEDGEAAKQAAEGGLEDDDVWGDVDDVSLLTKFLIDY